MSRSRKNAYARIRKLFGAISGTTFQTNPSGTTIYKSTIKASTVQTDALNNSTSSGYALPYGTATGLKMTSGILAIGSGASLARQSLGLSAIYNVLHNVSIKGAISAVTGAAVMCTPEGTKSFGSACTRVTFTAFKLNMAGVTFTAGCSVNYVAIGT